MTWGSAVIPSVINDPADPVDTICHTLKDVPWGKDQLAVEFQSTKIICRATGLFLALTSIVSDVPLLWRHSHLHAIVQGKGERYSARL